MPQDHGAAAADSHGTQMEFDEAQDAQVDFDLPPHFDGSTTDRAKRASRESTPETDGADTPPATEDTTPGKE